MKQLIYPLLCTSWNKEICPKTQILTNNGCFWVDMVLNMWLTSIITKHCTDSIRYDSTVYFVTYTETLKSGFTFPSRCKTMWGREAPIYRKNLSISQYLLALVYNVISLIAVEMLVTLCSFRGNEELKNSKTDLFLQGKCACGRCRCV